MRCGSCHRSGGWFDTYSNNGTLRLEPAEAGSRVFGASS